jgi:hypothetical protein
VLIRIPEIGKCGYAAIFLTLIFRRNTDGGEHVAPMNQEFMTCGHLRDI